MAKEETKNISEVIEGDVNPKKITKKKIHNFRFLTILYASGGLAAALFTILYFVFNQIDRMYMGSVNYVVNPQEKVDNQIFGFVIFTLAIVTLIIAIMQIYNAVPYIMKKDKLQIHKWYGIMSLVLSTLCLVMMAFSIVNMFYMGEHRDIQKVDGVDSSVFIPYHGTYGFWIPVALGYFLTAVYSIVIFPPILSVKVYLPEFAKRQK